MKKGITLVSMLLVVIVMSILATTIILEVSHDDLLHDTKELKFKEDLYRLQEQVEVKIGNLTLEQGVNFKREEYNLTATELLNTVESVPESLKRYAKVKNGELVLNGNFKTEVVKGKQKIIDWCNEVGVTIE